jgi:glycosyltransferase involved in cell wall biosynthesis
MPIARHIARRVPRPNYSRLPDRAVFWYAPAEQAARHLIDAWHPHVMFSSSGPAGAHIVTSRLARYSGLPWVADFRDLWTNNPIVAYPRWIDALERRYERRVLDAANHIVTVSEPLADHLCRLHGKAVSVIPNGYDPEDFGEAPAPEPQFTLTYTGQLIPGTQDPEPLFAALATLAARGEITPSAFRLQFVGGTHEGFVRQLAERHGVREYVEMVGMVPHEESIRRQQASAALLMLNIVVADCPGILSGKLPEYLGARRPILAVGPEDPSVSAFLRETMSGEWAGTPNAVARVLAEWLTRHRAGTLSAGGSPAQVARYSRAAQGAALAKILRSVSAAPAPLEYAR